MLYKIKNLNNVGKVWKVFDKKFERENWDKTRNQWNKIVLKPKLNIHQNNLYQNGIGNSHLKKNEGSDIIRGHNKPILTDQGVKNQSNMPRTAKTSWLQLTHKSNWHNYSSMESHRGPPCHYSIPSVFKGLRMRKDRPRCPALSALCYNCNRVGHF